MCCVIKPMVTWNLQDVGSISRERCGGQGYLSVNRLGDLLAFSHAGITAEGDNRVLIQKVCKEYTADLAKGKIENPAMTMCPEKDLPKLDKIDNLDVILNLLRFRLTTLSTDLMMRMQKKVLEEKRPLFDVWMYEESDIIQDCGTCYGEHMSYSATLNQSKSGVFGPTNQKLMDTVLMIYGLDLIYRDLGWFLSQGVLNNTVGMNLGDVRSHYVKMISANVNDLIDGFAIDPIYSPIATDYETFNATKNEGELGPAPRL